MMVHRAIEARKKFGFGHNGPAKIFVRSKYAAAGAAYFATFRPAFSRWPRRSNYGADTG